MPSPLSVVAPIVPKSVEKTIDCPLMMVLFARKSTPRNETVVVSEPSAANRALSTETEENAVVAGSLSGPEFWMCVNIALW